MRGFNPNLTTILCEDERKEVAEEQIIVTAYSGYRGEETPREFIFHGKKVKVVEILTAWIEQGTGYKAIKKFFEVKGNDGSIHKIHHDEDTRPSKEKFPQTG